MKTELVLPSSINIDIPKNQFERVKYLQELSSMLAKIQEECNSFVEEELDRLSNVDDEMYEVTPVFADRKSTIIKIDDLKQDHPDLYRNCLSISGPNASKLLGSDKLWTLCLKYAGLERTLASSSITLKDLKKNLTEEEYKQYTQEIYKEVGRTVARK